MIYRIIFIVIGILVVLSGVDIFFKKSFYYFGVDQKLENSRYVAVLVVIFFVFLCFYTSQPINLRFMIGFAFYFFGATIISSLIYCKFTRNKEDDSEFANNKMYIIANLMIKFSVLAFSAFFVIIGLFLAWKCIYPEPAYESMPGIGALFFLGSLFIVGIMTLKVKNT